MPSWFFADYLLYPLAIALGYLGSTLQNWSLHRRTYTLECAVVDLEEKVLVEVKRRAGKERQSQRHLDEEILLAAKAQQPKEPDLPWWAKLKAN